MSRGIKEEKEDIVGVKKEVERKLNEIGETDYVRVEVKSKNPSLHT